MLLTSAKSRTLTLLLAAVTLAMGLGCSKTENAKPNDGTTIPRANATTTVSANAGPRPSVATECTDDSVSTAVLAKFPGATVGEIVCRSGTAIVTVKGVPGTKGDQVAVLQLKDGSWTVTASADAKADPKTFLPKDVSTALFDGWKNRHDPTPTTEGVQYSSTTAFEYTTSPSTIPGRPGCFQSDDQVICADITTTTAAPTTVAPTTTPPTTSTPVTTVAPSAYCLAHPLDKNCLSNPGYNG